MIGTFTLVLPNFIVVDHWSFVVCRLGGDPVLEFPFRKDEPPSTRYEGRVTKMNI